MRVWSDDAIVPPVTADELQSWLRLPDFDPLLNGMLILATDAVIKYVGFDLNPRQWNLIYESWPVIGTPTGGLSRSPAMFDKQIKLPYANLIRLISVEVHGSVVDVDDVRILNTEPASIYLDYPVETGGDDPAIIVMYDAGYPLMSGSSGNLTTVPEPLRQIILSVAAYLYKNRGGCNVSDAMKESGAMEMLVPWRYGGGVFF
jgi:hypothetical protein